MQLSLSPITEPDGRIVGVATVSRDLSEQEHREALYWGLLEAAPDAIVAVDTEGRIALANAQAERLFGYSRRNLLGQRIEMVVPEAAREVHVRHRQSYLDDPRPRAMGAGRRLTARHRLGHDIPVEISLNVLQTNGGPLVAAAIRDVTELRRAADASAQLAAIVDSSADAIVSMSLDGNILTWNRAAEDVYGYSAHEVTGHQIRFLVPPSHAADVARVLDQITAGAEIEPYESVRVRADGKLIDVSLRVSPVRDSTGRIIAASEIARDISEQIRNERQFRAQEENTRAILDTASDPFVSMNRHGAITEWNRCAETIFGWSREEVIGRQVGELLVPPALRSAYEDGVDQIIAGIEATALDRRLEVTALHRDGHQIPVELAVWQCGSGEDVSFNAFVRDISQQKLVEQALAHARDRAVEVATMKSQFVATVSHEIRTPINGVIGLTDLLMRTPLDDNQRRYAEGVRTSGRALLAVINDILDFSKAEVGKVTLVTQEFQLGHLVHEVAQIAAATARDKDLEIIADYPPMAAALRGDPGRIRQVLLNLAGNAVKFTDAGEVVLRVRATPDPARPGALVARFEVADSGPGISLEDQDRLFEPFFQVADAGRQPVAGTGLGLAICRQLTELMGGQIGVESAPGQGSCFWFTVPLEGRSEFEEPSVPDELTGWRVLIVDDNPTCLRTLTRQLHSWGVQSSAVESGMEALSVLRTAAERGESFDLTIVDQRMPGMDGAELVRRITTDPALPCRRTLMLTPGASTDASSTDALGTVPTLTKPVGPSSLFDCLVELLGSAGPSPSAHTALAPQGELPRGRILLAEDNEINQVVALDTLAALGYRADLARDGVEAVEMALTSSYQAVLMDCQMPNMDGYAATGELRRREGEGRHTPVIALTAGALEVDKLRCIEAGMDDFITKPLDPQELYAALARWTLEPTQTGE